MLVFLFIFFSLLFSIFFYYFNLLCLCSSNNNFCYNKIEHKKYKFKQKLKMAVHFFLNSVFVSYTH